MYLKIAADKLIMHLNTHYQCEHTEASVVKMYNFIHRLRLDISLIDRRNYTSYTTDSLPVFSLNVKHAGTPSRLIRSTSSV